MKVRALFGAVAALAGASGANALTIEYALDRPQALLACDEHVEFLYEYLANRGFPVELSPVGAPLPRLKEVSS